MEAYFAEVEKIAAKKPDILGHIDLVKKLNADGSFFDEESPRYKAAALKALQAARENDCILEVNTGGVYRVLFPPSIWQATTRTTPRPTSSMPQRLECAGPLFAGLPRRVYLV